MRNTSDDMPGKAGNGANRLMALDAVRGLAVVGMYIQHFALSELTNFVSGNTMILFILCSGISYSMMAQSMERKETAPAIFRARVLARAIFIDLAGYLILMLNGPFGVVLQAYAMLYLIGLLFVRCSARTLAMISAFGFVVCPPLMLMGMSLFEGAAPLRDIAGGPSSALAWLPVFAAGMTIGRMDPHSRSIALRLAALGAAILVPVKLFALFALPKIYDSFCAFLLQSTDASASMPDPFAVWPRNTLPPMWHMLFIDAPQGGSSFELLIGTGGCLILLAAVLLLEKKAALVLLPFARTGRVSLTLYSIQFVIAWVLMLANADPTSLGQFPFGDVLTALLVLAAGVLLSLLKNGPLENGMRMFERLFYPEKRVPKPC